jgi:hypothetical protein
VVLKGRQAVKSGRPKLCFYDAWNVLINAMQTALAQAKRVQKCVALGTERDSMRSNRKPWKSDTLEIRQGSAYLIQKARDLLEAQDRLGTEDPSHYGGVPEGRRDL